MIDLTPEEVELIHQMLVDDLLHSVNPADTFHAFASFSRGEFETLSQKDWLTIYSAVAQEEVLERYEHKGRYPWILLSSIVGKMDEELERRA